MKLFEKSNIAFISIVLVYSLYSGLFIARTSFVIDGERFFSLFDDAMISMRYAKNLVDGYGLVWNPVGERVEGYTNLLWVLYMSIFHLFPVAQSKISMFLQMSGALFLVINLFLVKKIALAFSNGSSAISTGAVLLTAFYLPLNNWSLQGMEVSIVTLIMSISIWRAYNCIKSNSFSIWLYVLLGVCTLIRIDMVVPFLGILVFMLMRDLNNRRKHLVYGLLMLIFFILLQTMFRVWYYGDILPNSYYLKLTGYPFFPRISRGIEVLVASIFRVSPILFLLPFSLLFFRRDIPTLLLFWVFLVQILYSIYVGGDAWESWGDRYWCIVMPVFFVLVCRSLKEVISSLASKSSENPDVIHKYVRYGFAVLVCVSLLEFHANNLREWLLINPPLHVQDNKKTVELALLLRRITNTQAKIAVVWAGAIPYFSERYSVDILGKNDKKIARENMRAAAVTHTLFGFYPGHLKWNYSYSIGELKPDVVTHLWGSEEEAKPYLDKNYRKVQLQGFTLHVLSTSADVLWDSIKVLSERSSRRP